jgi:hypothetical protein
VITRPTLQTESELFRQLQDSFPRHFENVFPDKLAPRTVIILPSLTMDIEILSKISGINHYEERLLCMLMLLRMPRTQVIYLTSTPIDPVIIDYYLHMLPGITGYHALKRLTLLSCHDSCSKPLTQKLLERPRLIKRIRQSIPPGHEAHMACFTVTPLERALALRLQVPIYGCDPDLFHLGTKSNSRKIFKACGIPVPPGFEDIRSVEGIVEALVQLKQLFPSMKRAVLKMNDGFSGDGNAVFTYNGIEGAANPHQWVINELPQRLKCVATDLTYEHFILKYIQMGGIVEAFIEGAVKESPSVQCRITPLGQCDIISTHDQVLGGESGQVFIGAKFPASPEYAPALGRMGMKVAEAFRDYGVLGRFGMDFICVRENNEWVHYAIEVNLRKGGTTHPYLMLQFLTDGIYDHERGVYLTANGQQRFYYASDNLRSNEYVGLTPHDLVDIAMINDLHYDGSSQEGVMFHLIGALSQYGKLGVVCIGSSPERAEYFYNETVKVLNAECRADFEN